ncbi:MAG: hybrid sensor histidine kinase/response regulator, partial [Burkholderiaceae bacterium]|nr:hybrid sensor histidine kinase/response regulator [Burkholderiaceae bacterium]
MLKFDRSSISGKLTVISVLSTGSALLLVFIAFTVTSVLSHVANEGKQLSALAGVVGINSGAALLSGNRAQAAQHLLALAVKDEIVQAALFDRRGQLFARYVADP